jgi:hypothetical protein
MSATISTLPVWLPPIRAGETDGRFIDTTLDLGAVGDSIPSLANVSVDIARYDGTPLGAGDLAEAGSAWPNTLDTTNLILTVGLIAPAAAAGVTYWITITVNPTAQDRVWIRDLIITVAAQMG